MRLTLPKVLRVANGCQRVPLGANEVPLGANEVLKVPLSAVVGHLKAGQNALVAKMPWATKMLVRQADADGHGHENASAWARARGRGRVRLRGRGRGRVR